MGFRALCLLLAVLASSLGAGVASAVILQAATINAARLIGGDRLGASRPEPGRT